MPRHFALGENYQAGRVEVNNTKLVQVSFVKDFTKITNIQFSLSDSGTSHVPTKVVVTKSSFKIRFQNNFTGAIDWDAKEL